MSGDVIVGDVTIPAGAWTLAGFRRWFAALGEDAPRVSWLAGDIFVDAGGRSFRHHLPVVAEIGAVLRTIARDENLGAFYPGGWITNERAGGVSTEPDGVFVSWASFRRGDARLDDEAIELTGRPDMVLEVVSKSSEKRDAIILRGLYAAAGIPEYWIVDARGETPSFDLLVLGDDGAYHEQPPDAEGFLASPVWGRSFRLRRVTNEIGDPAYRLDAKLARRGRTRGGKKTRGSSPRRGNEPRRSR